MSPHSYTHASDAIGPVGCRSCDLHEICRLGGLITFATGRSRQSTGTLRSVPAGTHLYRAGDPAHMLYAVRQGMLKTVHLGADGAEQILALNIPGEVLGLEAFSSAVYASDVIALQPAVCCELPLQRVQHVYGPESALVQLLSRAASPRPNPARGSIRQRVTRFLVELAARLTSRGLDGRQFALGLSRGEIANLLDTRIETVSRVMRKLHREGVIQVHGNQVRVLELSQDDAR